MQNIENNMYITFWTVCQTKLFAGGQRWAEWKTVCPSRLWQYSTLPLTFGQVLPHPDRRDANGHRRPDLSNEFVVQARHVQLCHFLIVLVLDDLRLIEMIRAFLLHFVLVPPFIPAISLATMSCLRQPRGCCQKVKGWSGCLSWNVHHIEKHLQLQFPQQSLMNELKRYQHDSW